MDTEKLIVAAKSKFPDIFLAEPSVSENRVSFSVEMDKLHEFATYLKHEHGFTLGDMAFGTDTKEEMEMRWYVGDPSSSVLAILKVVTDRNNPIVPTLSDLWIGFNWHEREAYDMLGIKFESHPDLRRIYLPENWEGHPLRQDYVYKRPKYRKPENKEEN